MNKTHPARHSASAVALGLLATALLSACAVPVSRVTGVYEEPGYQRPVARVGYGAVQRIEVEDTTVGVSGGGSVVGAIIGGAVGNLFGSGFGRAAGTALGVFGGAVVGNRVEQDQAAAQSRTVYRVLVRFDDGQLRRFTYRALTGLHTGERVRLQDGVLDRV